MRRSTWLLAPAVLAAVAACSSGTADVTPAASSVSPTPDQSVAKSSPPSSPASAAAGDPTQTATNASRTSFTDGTYRVDDRIDAGTYRLPDGAHRSCTITVMSESGNLDIGSDDGLLSGTNLDLGNITSDNGKVTVQIEGGDPRLRLVEGDTVTSVNCGTWQLV